MCWRDRSCELRKEGGMGWEDGREVRDDCERRMETVSFASREESVFTAGVDILVRLARSCRNFAPSEPEGGLTRSSTALYPRARIR